MLKTFITYGVLFMALVSAQAFGAEDPDELYEKGRFAEAEKAYARFDMDHPRDIRYRYNRGCAAYQNSDYQGAAAAFSSVLRRAEDAEMRFRSSYNLGNTAFKQGDFAAAIDYYKKAVLYNPESDEARYNLELTLREVEKQKKNKDPEKQSESQNDSSEKEKKEGQQKNEKKEEKGQEKDNNQDENQAESEKNGDSEQGKDSTPDKQKESGQEQPKDLSGELKARGDLPKQQPDDSTLTPPVSMIDKKKAGALLDNIKEDRSRYLRLQIPQDKKNGVSSGKDW